MIFEICALISVCLFALLAFFIIRTLNVVHHLISQLELRLIHFDSLLRAISNLGDLCEKETETKQEFPSELVEWLLLSMKLSKKLLKRR